jgi:GLPGLI family protein
MKSTSFLTIILAFFAAAIITGCDRGVFGERIKEGVITYHLEYPDGENNNSLVVMLPSQMTMSFKDDNTSTLIRGFAGCFVMNYIGDYAKKQNKTLLSVGFDKKYILVSDFGEPPFGTSRMADVEFVKTNDTTSICGYLCHKAVGHSNNCNPDFTLWYTNDIDIKSDGVLSPVVMLGGVLMEFDVEMMGIYIKAKAIEVSRQPVADEIFEAPEEYKTITRADLENVVHSFDGSKKNNPI